MTADLPAPDPRPLHGRGLSVIYGADDTERVEPLLAVLRGTKLNLIEVRAGDPGWVDAATGDVERVVVLWTAAVARTAGIQRLRGASGSATGDRLVVVPLDATPVPPILQPARSRVLDDCLRALGEVGLLGGVATVLDAIRIKHAALDRIRRWGHIGVAVGLALAAAILVWKVPTAAGDVADRAAAVALMVAFMPFAAGLFAVAWARVDRRFLGHRVGSYLIDRELEARARRGGG